jgi:two-component system sensor histidine kinase UhpB
LISYPSNKAIVEAAKVRAITVFVVDDPSALYLLNKMGMESDFRHSAPVFRDELRRAVRKGDTATLRAVTAGFAALDPDELKRIDEKWHGHTITSYRPYFTAAAYAAAAAILLLAGLVGWNRALRKGILRRTAEIQVLSEQKEADLRLVIDTIPTMAWSLRADGTLDFINRRWLDYAGLSLKEALENPTGTIHPDDLSGIMETWRGHIADGKGYEEEMRLRRADGEYRWFLVRTVPLRDERGNIVKWFGTSIDIEDRKRVADSLQQSATELRAMSRQLVDVQESERRNLARELHDRVGQNLTALKINLELLGPALNAQGDGNARARMIDSEALLESTIKTIDDVTSELRPQMLDDFGLAAALERYAREFSARTGIAVAVRGTTPSDRPAPQVEIALFRIAQEALNNVAKHAGARRVEIVLEHANGECTMSVQDDGIGLQGTVDTSDNANPRLGMVTMRERSQAIGGRFKVGTLPEGGTRLTVRVPY